MILIIVVDIIMSIITGRRIGTKTCEMGNMFPPDALWFGSDTYTNLAVLYNLYLDVKMMGFVYRCLTDGGGMA